MTTALVVILIVLTLEFWRLEGLIDSVKNIERLIHDEIERQHKERLAEDGRDREGRFIKGH